MCAEYILQTKFEAIEEVLGAPVVNKTNLQEWNQAVKLSTRAPVIQLNGTRLELTELQFPVNPFPNARLSGFDTLREEVSKSRPVRLIYDVPLWKSGFTSHPLLIPMTGFLEPAYWGEKKGSVIHFKINHRVLFFAAGIAIKVRPPADTKIGGFALLTHTSTPQMLHFHHRLVVVFKAEQALGYLRASSAMDRYAYTIENRYTDDLSWEESRKMARGWEKRIPNQIEKLEMEKNFLHAIE